jgi:hypothetical protein
MIECVKQKVEGNSEGTDSVRHSKSERREILITERVKKPKVKLILKLDRAINPIPKPAGRLPPPLPQNLEGYGSIVRNQTKWEGQMFCGTVIVVYVWVKCGRRKIRKRGGDDREGDQIL